MKKWTFVLMFRKKITLCRKQLWDERLDFQGLGARGHGANPLLGDVTTD